MKTEIEFNDAGTQVIAVYLDGQRYGYIGATGHTKKDQTQTVLVEWVTNCPECGGQFVTKTTRRAPMAFTRRCERHRVVGKNVSFKKPRFRPKR